jgi:membrane fusion protein, multidrug efflux system
MRRVALALALTLAACSSKPPPPAEPKPVPVEAVRVGKQTVPVMAEYVAQTRAMQEVQLVPRVEGYLEAVNFENGANVSKGQLLMQIQPTQYEAAVQAAEAGVEKGQAALIQAQSDVSDQSARARLSAAEANFFNASKLLDRVRPLAKAHAVPQTDLDNAEANYATNGATVDSAKANLADVQLAQRTAILTARSEIDQAEANLTTAKLNLSYTRIYSPVTGVISFLSVDQGNYVSPSKTPVLATVSTIDPIKVVFQLTDTDYLRVARQYDVAATTPASPALQLLLPDGTEYSHDGRFVSIERAVNPQTGTIAVETVFPNPTGLLRPGQYVRVDFPLQETPNAIVIPQSAVIQIQGASAAYVVGPDNKVQQRTISTGTQYRNAVVVTTGLQAGDVVIVQGVNKVRPDTLVAAKIVPMSLEPGKEP